MALSTEVEAKLPEAEAPQEIKPPSMEPVPAPGGAPGLLGLLSQPVVAIKLGAAALVLGALAVLLTPAAFPPRVTRLPPPLPPRAPARRPRHLARAGGSPGGVARRAPSLARRTPAGQVKHAASPGRTVPPRSMKFSAGPIRLHDRSGAVCVVALDGVKVAGRRVPAPWARDVRRLFAPPAARAPAPAARPALRLLAPNPGEAAVFNPPVLLRWSAVPRSQRYRLTLEALADPARHAWSSVWNLKLRPVTGTQFEVPSGLRWAPGVVYRWQVRTGDGTAMAAGRFRVLSEEQRERYQAARRTAGSSRLLRAAIDRSFGLYQAALSDLQALQVLQPHQPALPVAIRNVEADIRHQRALARVDW